MIITRVIASGLHRAAVELVNAFGHDPMSFRGILPVAKGTVMQGVRVLAEITVVVGKGPSSRFDKFVLIIEFDDNEYKDAWLLQTIDAEYLTQEDEG